MQNQGGVVGGTPTNDIGWRNHGTAVVGEFGGDVNGFGVTGISPDAQVRAISIFGNSARPRRSTRRRRCSTPGTSSSSSCTGRDRASTSRSATTSAATSRWSGGRTTSPRSSSPPRSGVIVVEAAGNGAENLDDAIYDTPAAGFPATWRNPFNPNNPSSRRSSSAPAPRRREPTGSDHGPDRSRLDFSNYGARVDAQGWGREVTTTATATCRAARRGRLVHRHLQRHLERLADRGREPRLPPGHPPGAPARRC